MQGTILIIEDEPDVRAGLKTVLEAEGYNVHEAGDGPSGLARITADKLDLMVLDLMIPGLDGFQLCREVRARGLTIPILILTARSSEVDKVLGLELGADDYVTKPFGVRELIARVRALLRRADTRTSEPQSIPIGEAIVDLKHMRIERGRKRMELYHYEAGILKLLLQREGQVVDRNEILKEVWGFEGSITTRTIDFHVMNLRRKIERDPAKPEHILTIHGVGYKFVR